MSESYEKLAQELITNTANPPAIGSYLFECPAASQAIIKRIVVTSIAGSGVRSFKMWHADAAVSPSNTLNCIVPAMSVDDGGMAEFEGTILMDALERLYVRADVASTLIITVYGLIKA